MVKRVFGVILSALLVAAAFTGCSGSGDDTGSKTESAASTVESAASETESKTAEVDDLGSEDGITLKVWGPATQQDILKSQVEGFKALYPDKNITIEVGVCEESEAKSTVLNDVSAAADVFAFASDQLNDFVKASGLSPVQNYGLVTEDNEESSVAAAKMNDILYAYPLTADNTYIMYYNKSIYTEDDVKSLDKMAEVAKKAGKPIYIDAGNGFYAATFSFTGGMSISHNYEEETEDHTFTDGKEEVASSYAAFAKLFKDGALGSVSVSEGVSALETGKASALVDGPWDATAIEKALGDNYAAVCLPTININGTDKPMVSFFGYKFLGVKADTKFPNAAHALARYLSGEACQIEKAEKLSIGPSNKVAAASDAVKNNVVTTAVVEQLKNSVPQLTVAGGFWNAHAAVGQKLSDAKNNFSTEELLQLLEDCIESTNEG